jgi:predicted secreted protein
MTVNSMIAHLTAGLALAAAAAPSPAGDPPLTYDRVTLGASASREVENDRLVAVLVARREGGDAARLAGEVNPLVRQALERARQVEGVKVQTVGYDTQPVYRQQERVGWRVSQSLRIESGDAERLGGLLGELQKELALESLGYAVSPERTAAAEEELMQEALRTFERRARQIASQLGRPDYRLVSLDVRSPAVPSPRAYGMMASMAASADTQPAIEGGTQTVTVTVEGTVELQRP